MKEGSRQAVLEALRAARPAGEAARAPAPPSGEWPIIDEADLLRLFIRRIEELGGRCLACASPAQAAAVLQEIVRKTGARRIVGEAHPLVESLRPAELLGAAYRSYRPGEDETAKEGERHPLENIDMGLTVAAAGAAETGALLFPSGPGGARLLSLLPPVHVALLPRAGLVAAVEEALSTYRTGKPPPQCLTLVAGPSRTADIEMILTIGVHGPKELYVIVVG